MLNERLEVKKFGKPLVHTFDGLMQYLAHMVHNVVRQFVCETVIATSSELDIGCLYSPSVLDD